MRQTIKHIYKEKPMTRLKEFLAVAAFCAASACLADATFEISDRDGNLDASINSVSFIKGDSLALMDSKWKILCSPKKSKAVSSTTPIGDSVWDWSATPGCSLVRTLSKEKDGARLKYEFTFAPGQEGKYIELCIYVPKACLDFPKDSLKTGAFEKPLSLQTLSGKVVLDPEGSIGGKWYFDDFREVKWSGIFRIRFSCEYDPASGSKGVAALSIKAEQGVSNAFLQIPLGKAATRTFADDSTHSGWTAQGHVNDLSKMSLGLLVCSGVPFDVNGRAAILKSENTPDFPVSSGVIKVEPAALCGAFYFLHTAAWSEKFDVPVAKYKILYADGSSAAIPLRYGREIIDWWRAQGTLNAKLAWKGLNGGGNEVGVYMMKAANPHPEKAVAGIEFVSENSVCAPALLAITAINSTIATKGQQEELDKIFSKTSEAPLDTSSWHKCAIAWNGGIEPGSAIDFSFLNHKPAGKFGFLKRVGGEFEFEDQPGKPVRFWGTNFAIEGPFPDKKLAPGIAQTMASQGVNLVRIHLYAARPTLLQSKDGGLNSEMLDKMLFLISELEKNGVYIYMDLNDGMCYDQLLKRPSTFKPEEYLKFESLFDPELKKATKRLAELLFTSVNPYNGKAIANDPGVAMFEIMNEVSITKDWHTLRKEFEGKEKYLAELETLWRNWLKANNLETREMPTHFNIDPVGRRFATEIDRIYLAEMSAYLRSLGIKVPICGTNMTFSNGILIASAQLDFMAEHDYWAHPDFKSTPIAYPTSSALSRPVWTSPVGALGKCALKNYPVVHG